MIKRFIMNKALYYADTHVPICRLEVKKHFDQLSDKEKSYAHYISRAGWEGTGILAAQLSWYAPQLFQMILDLFPVGRDISYLKNESLVSDENWLFFLEYSAQVLSNVGNYKSFGDTKFIPRIPDSEFEKIIKSSKSASLIEKFNSLRKDIYAFEPEEQLLLGYPADGHVSGYYSKNISKQDVEFVQKFLEAENISALNTRLFKEEKNGQKEYRVVIASSQVKDPKTYKYEDASIIVFYGDFKQEMSKIAENMEKAIPFAANEIQANMLKAYVSSFRTGSIDMHKDSQRWWIKDIGPVVESNIGFIETYRDPAGVRAEWEGFVAVVNKEMTKKFEHMVNEAHRFIERLPWPKDFEKDKFNKPDFTSLEVVSFATTGSPPAGINIPNYDDIRQTEGFKNVSLGNVLSAKAPGEKVTFISPNDLDLFNKYKAESFELQVGLHELLGHGSGKLLQEESAGKYNFDISNPPISPITKKPITTWYKPGETWGSVFKSIAASYEECRAECVAMYLCIDPEILKIFGHEGQEGEDIVYAAYLSMARAGLLSLEFYDPKSKKWGQAHMQARFAILQVFLKSGLARFDTSTKDDITIILDRTKINTIGVPAVGDFLMRLKVYKATADTINGTKFYEDATNVNEDFEKLREIVIMQKQPRKMFVQCNTFLENGKVVLKEYEPSLEGLIQSYSERVLEV